MVEVFYLFLSTLLLAPSLLLFKSSAHSLQLVNVSKGIVMALKIRCTN